MGLPYASATGRGREREAYRSAERFRDSQKHRGDDPGVERCRCGADASFRIGDDP